MNGDIFPGRDTTVFTLPLAVERMANPTHLSIIRKSVQAWNRWRAENCAPTPDLSGVDFTDCDLSEGSLKETDLEDAVFYNTNLCSTSFTGAEGLTASQLVHAETLHRVIDLNPLILDEVASTRPRLLNPPRGRG